MLFLVTLEGRRGEGSLKTNDYVKYMTQEIIKYMNTPRDERKEHKQEKMETKPPFSQRLFGVLPFGFSMMLKKRLRNRQK